MEPDLIGKTLGKYHILEEIGHGGMGTVYKAQDTVLDRLVATKVMAPRLTRDPELVQRFLHEARAIAHLSHPHIVTIHDVVQIEGYYFIVMDYLEGQSLTTLIRQEAPLSLQRTVGILDQLAQALDYAHAEGLIHRDVKPGNVVIGPDDHATLTDFGIAKMLEDTQLTRPGTLLGTPAYMAPELIKGEPAGPATDVYSLGVVAYEMLGGRPPFEGDTHRMLYAHVHEEPPSLAQVNPEVPPDVGAAVQKALSKEQAARWESAGTFTATLQQAAESKQPGVSPKPSSSTPCCVLGAILTVMTVAIVLLVAAFTLGIGQPGDVWAAVAELIVEKLAFAKPTHEPVSTFVPSQPPAATATPMRPATAPPRPTPTVGALVTAGVLNLRAGPNTAHPRIKRLVRGTALRVTARTSDGRWFQVITPEGTRGWVSSDYVTLSTSLQRIPVTSRTPTPPGQTSTSPPLPITPSAPRAVTYPKPQLKSPPDEYSTSRADDVVLRWSWPRSNQCGPLEPNEHFDVRVWGGGQSHRGIGWTKNCEYSLGEFLTRREGKTYHWAIAVIRGSNGKWEANLSPESEERAINWRSPGR